MEVGENRRSATPDVCGQFRATGADLHGGIHYGEEARCTGTYQSCSQEDPIPRHVDTLASSLQDFPFLHDFPLGRILGPGWGSQCWTRVAQPGDLLSFVCVATAGIFPGHRGGPDS